MNGRRRLSAAVLLVATVSAVATVAVPAPASAHTVSNHWQRGWWSDNKFVEYGLQTGFPTGAIRAQLFEGKEQWNKAASTNEPTVLHSLPDGNYGSFTNECGVLPDKVGVFWMNLDPIGGSGLSGATRICNYGTSHISSATIAFDSTRTWYFGTGDAPSNATDFWSTASHEWGACARVLGAPVGN